MKILSVLLLLFMGMIPTGCSMKPEIKTVTEYVDRIVYKNPIVLPAVESIRAFEPKWIVITKENADELLNSNNDVLFAVTFDDYKNFSIYTNDVYRYVRQMTLHEKLIRDYYENKDEAEAIMNGLNAVSNIPDCYEWDRECQEEE